MTPTCANLRCLNGANCPGHPWREDELDELRKLEATSRDMNDAGYRGSGFRQARKFFAERTDETVAHVDELISACCGESVQLVCENCGRNAFPMTQQELAPGESTQLFGESVEGQS